MNAKLVFWKGSHRQDRESAEPWPNAQCGDSRSHLPAPPTTLRDFVHPDIDRILALALAAGERIIVEGTQGFGLSILHGRHYPYATSRDTTAAGVLSEAGLSPRDVDCVALTLRSFPIRVHGNSGPLPLETTWRRITRNSGANADLTEFTTVTGRPRRVAEFHEEVVLRAIRANRPDIFFLNHVDYFDYTIHDKPTTSRKADQCVSLLESRLGLKINYIGSGPSSIITRPFLGWIKETSRLKNGTNSPRSLSGIGSLEARINNLRAIHGL